MIAVVVIGLALLIGLGVGIGRITVSAEQQRVRLRQDRVKWEQWDRENRLDEAERRCRDCPYRRELGP